MMGSNRKKIYLAVELMILFVVLPTLFWLDLLPFHKIIPLIILFIYCLTILVYFKRIDRNLFVLKANWKVIFVRWIVIGSFILFYIYAFTSTPVWADLGSNKKLLYMIIMYPFLSVFPQELIFREFFFWRYRPLVPQPTALLVTNIILFAFAHIYFSSSIVLVFTLIGGAIFAFTYFQTKSLAVVVIEHTLYGMLILGSGLSEYFYKAF